MKHIRTLGIAFAAMASLSACVTKGTFRREMNDRENELRAERGERVAGDSTLRADFTAQIAQLRTELDTMRTQFNTRITAMEDGIKFAMPVNFAFDDASVRPEDQAALDRFAQIVSKYYGGSMVTIEGFADPAGAPQYNVQLSRRRAESVRDYLSNKGLTADQLRTIGYGETRQVVAGAERDEPGAEMNRRVVFVVETRGQVSQLTAQAVTGTE
jgi:outer membrane protein OmpA-like peptidoglycan-associated protein